MACGSRSRSHERLQSPSPAMTNSTKSLREGGRVVICGLHGNLAASLNGSTGLLKRFDNSCGRWEVDTATAGFKKVKPVNLLPLNDQQMPGEDNIAVVPHPLTIRRRSKLCRFGQTCWRPDCHFVHGNEEQRCDAWARLWAQEPISASSASETAVSLKDSLPRLQADLSSHKARLETQSAQLLQFKGEVAELQAKCEQYDASSNNQRVDDLEQRIATMGDMLGESLDEMMLQTLHGALQAACVPLAEQVAKKMVELEIRVDSLFANVKETTPQLQLTSDCLASEKLDLNFMPAFVLYILLIAILLASVYVMRWYSLLPLSAVVLCSVGSSHCAKATCHFLDVLPCHRLRRFLLKD